MSRRKEVSTDNESVQQDGGYGWLIVFGAFSVQFWVAGLVKRYFTLPPYYLTLLSNFSILIQKNYIFSQKIPKMQLWRSICGNIGNFFDQFNGGCILDSSYFISIMFSIGTSIKRFVPTIFMPNRCFHRWPVLCTWSHAELLCNFSLPFTVHIWNSNRFVIC